MIAAPISRRRALRVGGALVGAAMLLQNRLIGKAAACEPAPGEESMASVTSADGTRIAYQRSGEGPPLVLVHGILDDHHRWAQLLPALGEHFTVYALDRRGRGGSMATDGAAYAVEREFEDVAAVVDATGEPAHLFGHSFGALCALEAALLTENLRTLVLYEPPIPLSPRDGIGSPGALEEVETLLAAGDREGAVLVFAREIAQVPEEAIAAFRAGPGWEGALANADTIVREVQAAEGYSFSLDPARFRGMSTPTMLMMGSESPLFLQTATKAVSLALPRAKHTLFPNQGHLAMDTAPNLFLRELVQFLTEA